MAVDGSMALWCVHRAGQEEARAELHFNYWRLAGDADFKKSNGAVVRDFIEVGILLFDPTRIDSVSIYVPWKLDRSDLMDCGPKFADPEIAQGIFNEYLTCNAGGPPGPKYVELRKSGKPFCRVHQFWQNGGMIDTNNLAIEEFSEGVIVTIARKALDECIVNMPVDCPAYFRLRFYVGTKHPSPFVRVITPKDRFFQSSSETIEYVDFRLNEARTLPDAIESRMRTEQGERKVVLSRVAFLTAVPVSAAMTVSSKVAHKTRLLEHEIWTKYVPSGIPPGMMVYHWRVDSSTPQGVVDFSAFVKLQIRRTGRKALILYLAIAFIFAIVGNLAAAGITSVLGREPDADGIQRRAEQGLAHRLTTRNDQ
ncbi:hypothetical protein K32_13100 [Kaistia sp. 32K]|uniref:hypothetical protein n=1 Tax=Kaistia sp. 32K TaxID=2795690 RepID=UPI001915882C|nr:hypothetical protein [Kaistia sp. 32K]BCP52693.1 hypothetical protein K32_13100 [Kaistia sp. 32K]